MNGSWPLSLAVLLPVGVGGVLLLAALAVWWRGRQTRASLQTLLALPADTHPLQWPQQAQAALQSGGVVGLAWRGQWFGDDVQGQWGNAPVPGQVGLQLDAGSDCHMHLTWATGLRTDEGQALTLALVDVFAQAWVSRMRSRTQAVAVALAQRAHMHLYWQHDMRNLAQWVSLLAEEFEDATPDELPLLAARLQRQAPLLHERARKLLQATQRTASPPPAPSGPLGPLGPFAPSDDASRPGAPAQGLSALRCVQDAAELAGVALAPAPAPADSTDALLSQRVVEGLERALDNVFSNVARHWRTLPNPQPLGMRCHGQGDVLCITLQTPSLPVPWPERPFEPLQSATGTGLGLYQARRSLREMGGDLQAEPNAHGVVFRLVVPVLSVAA